MIEKLSVEMEEKQNTDLHALFFSSILLLLVISEIFNTYVYV